LLYCRTLRGGAASRRSDRDRYGEGRDGGGERPAAEAPAPVVTPTEPAEKVEA